MRCFRSIYEFPKVTIAAVNGPAIAGGTGLALLCDFTLAAPEAKVWVHRSLASDLCLPSFPLSCCGKSGKSRRAIFCSREIFEAEEASQLGLVTEIVSADKLMERLAN